LREQLLSSCSTVGLTGEKPDYYGRGIVQCPRKL
jgi:hypothetical protein